MEIGFTHEGFGEVLDFRPRYRYTKLVPGTEVDGVIHYERVPLEKPQVVQYTCLVRHENGNIVMATWHEPAARWGFSVSGIKWKDPDTAAKWWASHTQAVDTIEARAKKEYEERGTS